MPDVCFYALHCLRYPPWAGLFIADSQSILSIPLNLLDHYYSFAHSYTWLCFSEIMDLMGQSVPILIEYLLFRIHTSLYIKARIKHAQGLIFVYSVCADSVSFSAPPKCTSFCEHIFPMPYFIYVVSCLGSLCIQCDLRILSSIQIYQPFLVTVQKNS